MLNIVISIQTADIQSAEAKRVINAINTQLKSHFGPLWHIDARLSLVTGPISFENLAYGGVIIVADKANIEGALGYHDRIKKTGLPIGYVFQDICEELGEPWSVTLSHEVLEMVLNRHTNYYAIGPHPKEKTRNVIHWLEACDAVQDQTYEINKVLVSDFIAPLFFTPEREVNEKVNFLGTSTLRSFECTAGGYLGFFDPKLGRDDTYFKAEAGRHRFEIKQKLKNLRRKEQALRSLRLL